MSSRALRKLHQQKELEAEKARVKSQEGAKANEENEEPEQDSEEEDSPVTGSGSNLGARAKMPPHRNPFDLVSTTQKEKRQFIVT
jgi:hypothetical protein